MDGYSISERSACSLVGLSRAAYRYMPLPRDDEEPLRHCYINEKLQLDENTSLQNSPILLQQNAAKPLDIFVGEAELLEMQKQSIDFSAYRNSTNAVGIFKNIPERNHYTILDELISKDGEIFKVLYSRLI